MSAVMYMVTHTKRKPLSVTSGKYALSHGTILIQVLPNGLSQAA